MLDRIDIDNLKRRAEIKRDKAIAAIQKEFDDDVAALNRAWSLQTEANESRPKVPLLAAPAHHIESHPAEKSHGPLKSNGKNLSPIRITREAIATLPDGYTSHVVLDRAKNNHPDITLKAVSSALHKMLHGNEISVVIKGSAAGAGTYKTEKLKVVGLQ